ncbi:hypothetical protein [Candidatus Protochlamydia phocaeensis]|uniref:hypothetical protein n=1 Tax=Candidatus Protochlamydia phocaeensis TaxID=1414722 RepID=UPI0008389F57|nr:hypothetical protein [Candidatus Protochlamydia phocaeensis]
MSANSFKVKARSISAIQIALPNLRLGFFTPFDCVKASEMNKCKSFHVSPKGKKLQTQVYIIGCKEMEIERGV